MSGRKAMLKSPGDVSGAFVVLMAGVAGFEPANAGVRVPCLTAWRHPIMAWWAM